MRPLFVGDKDTQSRWGVRSGALMLLVSLAAAAWWWDWPEHLPAWFEQATGAGSTQPAPPVTLNEPVQVPSASALAEAASSPETTQTPSAEPSIEAQVTQFVSQWALDWSQKNVDAYFSAYASNFVPEGGKSRAEWAQERRQRIVSKKKISVQIKSLGIVSSNETGLTVSFVQIYEADQLTSTTQKILLIGQREGQLGILREFTP